MGSCNTCTHCDVTRPKCHPGVEGFAETYPLEADELFEEAGCDFYSECVDHTETIKLINDLKAEIDTVQSICIVLSDLNWKLKNLTDNINASNIKEYTDAVDKLRTFNELSEEYKTIILSRLDKLEGSRHGQSGY